MKKDSRRARLSLLAVPLAVSACQSRTGGYDAGPTTPLVTIDAGSRPGLRLKIEIPLSDGGIAQASLDPSAAVLLPLSQSLDVTANLPLHNYRLRILDELDRALASDDAAAETHGELRYHIALVAPLRPGHRYTLVLDAQSGATLDNGNGAPLNEQRFDFRTEGERDKDAPPKASPKRHHRHPSGK